MHACTQYFTFVFGVVCSSTFPLYVRLYKCRKYERKTIAHDIKAPNYDHWDLLYYTVLTMHVSISAWLKMLFKVRQYATDAVVFIFIFVELQVAPTNQWEQKSGPCIIKGGIFPPTAVSQSLTIFSLQHLKNITVKNICVASTNPPCQASLSSTGWPSALQLTIWLHKWKYVNQQVL